MMFYFFANKALESKRQITFSYHNGNKEKAAVLLPEK